MRLETNQVAHQTGVHLGHIQCWTLIFLSLAIPSYCTDASRYSIYSRFSICLQMLSLLSDTGVVSRDNICFTDVQRALYPKSLRKGTHGTDGIHPPSGRKWHCGCNSGWGYTLWWNGIATKLRAHHQHSTAPVVAVQMEFIRKSGSGTRSIGNE